MSLVWSPDYAPVDGDFADVSLLLKGEGTNGSTTILDSSSNNLSVSVNGDAQISTAVNTPFGTSDGVLAFDGNGDYLTVPANADCNFGTGDFTVEAWVNRTAIADNTIIAGRGPTNGTFMFTIFSNNLRIGRNNVSWDLISPALSFNTNQWYHIAAVRENNVAYLFVDGSVVASGSNTQTYNLTEPSDTNFAVGARQALCVTDTVSNFMQGYISNLRITKGVARYTSNFTPPTAPFPIYSPTTRAQA